MKGYPNVAALARDLRVGRKWLYAWRTKLDPEWADGGVELGEPEAAELAAERTRFLEKIFASDRKVKVPSSARRVMPGSDLNLEEIRKRWDESREELKDFVSRGDSALLSKGIFRHPVGGWMGAEQILRFFSVHLIHHGYQLDRIAGSAASYKTVAKTYTSALGPQS